MRIWEGEGEDLGVVYGWWMHTCTCIHVHVGSGLWVVDGVGAWETSLRWTIGGRFGVVSTGIEGVRVVELLSSGGGVRRTWSTLHVGDSGQAETEPRFFN